MLTGFSVVCAMHGTVLTKMVRGGPFLLNVEYPWYSTKMDPLLFYIIVSLEKKEMSISTLEMVVCT